MQCQSSLRRKVCNVAIFNNSKPPLSLVRRFAEAGEHCSEVTE